MSNKTHWKTLISVGFLGYVRCTSHICDIDASLCSVPTDATLTSGQSVSTKSASNMVSFTVNDVGLHEDWYARLEQNSTSGWMPNADPCPSTPVAAYHCIEVPMVCESPEAGSCTIKIPGQTLSDQGFAVGQQATLIVSQLPRALGKTPTLDIRDPYFDFGPWQQTALPDPQGIPAGTMYTNLVYKSIAIIQKELYVSRSYNEPDIARNCAEVISGILGSPLMPITTFAAACDSTQVTQYAFSGSNILQATQTALDPKPGYTIFLYDIAKMALGSATKTNITEQGNLIDIDKLAISWDSTTLFATGADKAVYTSPLAPLMSPLSQLATAGTKAPLLMPLSKSSLLVVGSATLRYDFTTSSWNSADLSNHVPADGVVAIGAGDLAGARNMDLAVYNGQQIVFYKNNGNNDFAAVVGGLTLPSPDVLGIAVGDLDANPGKDLAVLTPTSVYIASHL